MADHQQHPVARSAVQGQSANLADVLERVLDKGIVIAGDIKLLLADIEVLTLQIRLVIVSVDKAREIGLDWWRGHPAFSGHAPREAVAVPSPAAQEVVAQAEVKAPPAPAVEPTKPIEVPPPKAAAPVAPPAAEPTTPSRPLDQTRLEKAEEIARRKRETQEAVAAKKQLTEESVAQRKREAEEAIARRKEEALQHAKRPERAAPAVDPRTEEQAMRQKALEERLARLERELGVDTSSSLTH